MYGQSVSQSCSKNMKVILANVAISIANTIVCHLELFTNSCEFQNERRKKGDDWTFFACEERGSEKARKAKKKDEERAK